MTAEHYKRQIPPEERLLRKVYHPKQYPDIEVRPITKASRVVLRDLVSKVLSGLPKDERDVLVYRFKLGFPVSRRLKQIGSPSKVSQIKNAAIGYLQSEKIRKRFSGFYWIRNLETSYVKAWVVYTPPKLEEPEKVAKAQGIFGEIASQISQHPELKEQFAAKINELYGRE